MQPRLKDQTVLKLVNKIHIIETEQKLQKFLIHLSTTERDRPVTIGFINAHALNLCYQDDEFLSNLLQLDYVLRDGIGIKILFKMLGREPGLNLNGTDLIPKFLDQFTNRTISIYGTEEPFLTIAAEKINEMGIRVEDKQDGFQSDEYYLDAVARVPANLTILGMGMPKQEKIAIEISNNISHGSLVICGGAILDFIAGKVTRAPKIFSQLGLEWFYRLALEPKRLFRRYVIGNFVMLWHALHLTIVSKKTN